MVNTKEARHIAGRFVIHYFSAFGVLLLVLRFATEPLFAISESTLMKIMAMAFAMGAIAVKEIFDASKLAVLRGDLIRKIMKTGATPPRHKMEEVLNDPRYTLKKSIYDLIGWGSGMITALILL